MSFSRSLALIGAAASFAAAPSIWAADAEPYPIKAVFDSFVEGCGSVADADSAKASLNAAGWVDVSTVGIPALADFMDFARTSGARLVGEAGGTMSDTILFQKQIAGEDLAIVVSEVVVDGNRVTGCRLFDPGEDRAPDMASVTALVQAEPDQTQEREGNIILQWFSGIRPEHDSFDFYFIPAGSPLETAAHFNGLAMKIDSVGPVGNE